MRIRNTLCAMLAMGMGLSLAACTRQAAPDAGSSAASPSANATAQRDFLAATAMTEKSARFAAAPDRGELLRYDAQAPVRDGAYTWNRTELSEQHALDAIRTGLLQVATPDGRLLGFVYDRSIRHDSGDWTWIGHLRGQEGVQAILTFGAGAVFGSIGQPAARPLRLTMRDGASWLVETDPTRLAGLASHAAHPVSPDYLKVAPAALQRLRESQSATAAAWAAGMAPRAASVAAAITTVDLVIGYTQGFAAAHGSAANAVTRLNNIVDTANAGLGNSQVTGQIRLVHTLQVNYTDTNTNDVALGQLTGYDSNTQQETTPNAAFNALRAAREQYGADLVSLVRPFREPEQDSCGIAWLVGGGKQLVTASNGWDFFGYSVVSDGTDRNENDGKTYFCEEHTLAHELGHNMGSAHDRATQMSDDGVLDDPDDYGAFSYSFGYKPAAFYTIMAYGDSGQTSYLTFSNPRTTFCGGVACGVNNSEDNAKSLGQVMPAVAGFRVSVVTGGGSALPVARRIDANGNARADLFFFNHSTASLVTWFMNGTSRTAYATSSIPSAYSVVGAGAFNSDAKDDLLLSASGGKLYLGMSNGSTFAVQAVANTVASPSQVVDAADMDGNGTGDIVLRNPSTGQVVIWYMSNGVRTAYRGTAFSPTLTYVLAADFNNDRKADLLFQDAQRNLFIAINTGSSFTLQSVGLAYSSTYAVRGATDVSGDGSADLLLHDAAANKLVVWYMHGATRAAYSSMTAPTGAVLVAHGDFDGNKKSDVGWVHPTTGNVWLSLSAGSSFTTSLLPYTFPPATSNPMDIDL